MRRILEILGSVVVVIVAALAATIAIDYWPTARARADFDSLPDFNYLAAADQLRSEQRYAEAAMVARAGQPAASPVTQPQLQAELTQIAIERNRGDRPRPVPVDAGNDAAARAGHDFHDQIAEPANDFSPYGGIKDPQTLRRAEILAGKPGGVFALWISRDLAAEWLKRPDPSSDDWLIRAAAKGRAGVDKLLEEDSVILRPHPLVTPLEGFLGERLPARLQDLLDTKNEMAVGMSVGALIYLLIALAFSMRGPRPAPSRSASRLVRMNS